MAGSGLLLLMILVAGLLAHTGPNTFEMSHDWRPLEVEAFSLAALFLLCLVTMYGGQVSPYLYFQF